MGIRFLCKHCQRRLNVKEKQVGQYVFCPDCENEILIPLASTIEPLKRKKRKKKRKKPPAREVDHSPSTLADAEVRDVVGIPDSVSIASGLGLGTTQEEALFELDEVPGEFVDSVDADSRIAAERAKQLAEEEAEAERMADEAEAKRLAEEEAARVAAEKEAEAKRFAEEQEANRLAEEKRLAEEAEAKRLAEETEAKRLAEEEAARIAAEEEAEAKRLAEEAEAKRIAEEAEAKRLAEEVEAKRLAEEEAARIAAEKEAEAKRLADEAEAKRIAEEAEAEAKRLAEEAEAKRLAEEAARLAAEKEAEAKRLAEEAEAIRLAEEAAKRNFDELPLDDSNADSTAPPTDENVDLATDDIDSLLGDGDDDDTAMEDEELIASAMDVLTGNDEDDGIDTDDEPESESFLLAKPVAKVEQDPLKSNPDLVWYLRHKRAGEKGPLKARDLETMLDEGSIRRNSIVWREDWNDWLPVEEVFPQLAEKEKSKSTYEIPEELNPHSEVSRKRRAKKRFWMCFNGVAFLVVALLVYWIITIAF